MYLYICIVAKKIFFDPGLKSDYDMDGRAVDLVVCSTNSTIYVFVYIYICVYIRIYIYVYVYTYVSRILMAEQLT
jgi:hypothetical protein